MTGVDVPQLQDGSFFMYQKAYVDNIDPAEVKVERRKTPEASVTEEEKIHIARSLGIRAIAVHTDGCKKSMCRVNVTIVTSSGSSCHVDEIQSNTQGDEVRSCGTAGARTS